jgi:hypothetical protein
MRLPVPTDMPPGCAMPGLFHARLPMLRRWLCACRGPEVGAKPGGMRITERAWRRNSALIASLQEQGGS